MSRPRKCSCLARLNAANTAAKIWHCIRFHSEVSAPMPNEPGSENSREKKIFYKNKKRNWSCLACLGFDPRTSGLWARRSSPELTCLLVEKWCCKVKYIGKLSKPLKSRYKRLIWTGECVLREGLLCLLTNTFLQRFLSFWAEFYTYIFYHVYIVRRGLQLEDSTFRYR